MAIAKFLNAKQFMITAEKNRTKHNQNKSTGFMTGRHVVSEGYGDQTRNIRASETIDLNRDGKIDERDIRGGEILGRMGKGEAKPSKIEVSSHYRKGKFVSHHIRKIH